MTNYKAGEAFQLQRVMKVYDGNNDVLQMSEAIILNNKVIVIQLNLLAYLGGSSKCASLYIQRSLP